MTSHDRTIATTGSPGFVSLVGAGPGHPDLLTRRAIRRLRAADIVFHDGLVPQAILRLASSARCISVARRAGPKRLTQADVNCELIASARAGHRVVRLKNGDPFIFARGAEEADALTRANIRFEVVPGVSSATAAATLAGIALTSRGVTSAIVVLSGHAPDAFAPTLDRLVPGTATIVILMGLARRTELKAHLLQAGWLPRTPVAIVLDASRRTHRIHRRSIATMAKPLTAQSAYATGVVIVGKVAGRVYGCTR